MKILTLRSSLVTCLSSMFLTLSLTLEGLSVPLLFRLLSLTLRVLYWPPLEKLPLTFKESLSLRG